MGREIAPDKLTQLGQSAYLLLSQEDGGFSRRNFLLEDEQGKRQLVFASYVDMVVDEKSVADGELEEILSHDLGHQILGELAGPLPQGRARNMHQSMTVTDEPTAFDEGYAEHFQPLVRDASDNPRLRELTQGATSSDLGRLWISRLDEQLRSDGVKRNVFIHAKALPPAALDLAADRYQVYLDDQTSTAFLSDELRNGQQMMASEGVIATLFYRVVNDTKLREHYREAAFSRAFLRAEVPADRLGQTVSPYENVNLKLFVAMRRAAKPIAGGALPTIAVVDAYATAFPDEAREIYRIFLDTTRGTTASQKLAADFERAGTVGRRGDLTAFRSASRDAFSLLKTVVDRVAAGELRLDTNLGPHLWLLNPDFNIASAIWNSERTLALTLNLNTASEVDLMTIPGVDLIMARKIVVARRSHGFFRTLDEIGGIVSPELMQRFRKMADELKTAPAAPRQ
jgi:hypothetical protein